MQVVPTAIDDSLADAWRRFCGDLEFVKVRSGSQESMRQLADEVKERGRSDSRV